MTKEQFQQQSVEVAHVFLDAAAAQGLSHNILMAGMLLALESVAMKHSCCTQSAGRDLLRMGAKLLGHISARPANAQVH